MNILCSIQLKMISYEDLKVIIILLDIRMSEDEGHPVTPGSKFERFSYIFQQSSQTSNPTFASTKNNLLIILLCISVYFIFYLAQDFVNIILLGFLFGVAYGKLRERFVVFWKRESKNYKFVDVEVVLKCAAKLILCIILPWLAYICQTPEAQISFSELVAQLYGRSNVWVRIGQIFLFISIIYNIYGNVIDDILFFRNMSSKTQKFLDVILAIAVIVMVLVIFVLFLTTIAIELRNAGIFVKESFETSYKCRFHIDQSYDFENKGNIFCQDKIPENLKQFVPNIDQERLKDCLNKISELQTKYVGEGMFPFKENLCTGINILEQLNPNFLQNISTTQTTSYAFTVLFNIFGIIINVVLIFTNGVFKLTTFASIFIITLANYEYTTSHLHIFGRSKEQLVGQIAVIIQATFFIAVQHLAFSIAFLQIVDFSSVNILISILLSMVAFIPYVKPSFIMGIMAVINIALGGRYIVNSIQAVIYWIVSEYIYSRNYSGVGLHKVIINLSVIFGIYQFGVSGILYGPLIIILFQSVIISFLISVISRVNLGKLLVFFCKYQSIIEKKSFKK